MNNKKIIFKEFVDMLVNLFANVFLWFLIYAAAIISFAQADEFFLAFLLVLSGVAWLYKDIRNFKQEGKK